MNLDNNRLDNNKLYGVAEGVQYGQNERVDELNSRISSRQFPDSPLEPNFTPRAIPTKYSKFPMMNRRKELNEPVIPYLQYNSNVNFSPGSSRAPPSGILNNINTESALRNQFFALQKGVGQNEFVPSSTSDLYNVSVISRPEEQPYPLLFNRPSFDSREHPNNVGLNVGKETFFNHTRTQLRGSQ